jgi:hypothetical protein
MHSPAILADQHTEPVLTGWLSHLVLDIGTGPDGGGITFGSLAEGIVVAQRRPGVWSVSFRPIASDGSRRRYYTNPHVVARVIITPEHDDAAVRPTRQQKEDSEADLAELAETYLDDGLARTGHEPEPGTG